MSPFSPWPALVITLIALAVIGPLSKLFQIKLPKGHVSSIDGLRGFLALFVFFHHSVVWYIYLTTHSWHFPFSALYNHFGSTSVAVFFMITAFLFFGKMIDSRSGTLDWLKLYTGRIMRIMPLFLVALSVMLVIVAFVSKLMLHEPVGVVGVEILKWVLFARPDVNGVDGTSHITAGVTWSLLFEWLFYASLVIFGKFVFSIETSNLIYFIQICCLLFFAYLIYIFYPEEALWRMCPFLGGMLAAFLSRNDVICRVARSPIVSIFIIVCLVLTVTYFFSIFEPVALLLICICFNAIACGNSLFGLLTSNFSRLLGQISYSIYMMHGIILFVTFTYVLGFEKASRFSTIQHWMVIAGSCISLIMICCVTYKFIELPGINYTPRLTMRIRRLVEKNSEKKN